MSREILLRGKRTDNGEWVEGHMIKYPSGKVEVFKKCEEPPDVLLRCEVDPDTLCQYTGLTDKNGKKIWENDIVKYQFDNDDCPFPNKHTEKIIGRIFFSDFRASFSVTAGRKGSSSINNDLFRYVRNGNRVEVIGNIFDNPELLEVEHE